MQIPRLGFPHIGCSSMTEAVSNFHAWATSSTGRDTLSARLSILWKGGGGVAAQAPNPRAVLYWIVCRESKSICLFSQQTPTFCSAPWQQLWARGNHSSKLHLALCYRTVPTKPETNCTPWLAGQSCRHLSATVQ